MSHGQVSVLHEGLEICAGGAGFPLVESLEDLYNYNSAEYLFFLRSGETPATPFPSEGSCRRGCPRKLEVMICDRDV